MHRRLLLIVFIFTYSSIRSQKFLFHKNNYKEKVYQVGDVISFQLVGDRTKITRQIFGFEDSLIVFKDYKINPKAIGAIYVDKKTRTWFVLRYKYQYVLPEIGGGYILLELINTGKIDEDVVVFGGSCIAAGILARLIIPNRIKIKGKRRLVIVR